MGNIHSEKSLLNLCEDLYNKSQNYNQIDVKEYNEKIRTCILKYKTIHKLYSDDDLLEYETIIVLTEKDNIFYKQDSQKITNIQYAFNLYTKTNIKHDAQVVIDLLSCFPNEEARCIGRFCFNNKVAYQQLITYSKNDLLKYFSTTNVYTMYAFLKELCAKYNFNISFLFDRILSKIIITMNNNNNKDDKNMNGVIKYMEDMSSYTPLMYNIICSNYTKPTPNLNKNEIEQLFK
jgi:hypothetical protein